MPKNIPDCTRAECIEILNDLRDLSDFCVHWPQLKPMLQNITELSEMDREQIKLVQWLCLLADKTHSPPNMDEET